MDALLLVFSLLSPVLFAWLLSASVRLSHVRHEVSDTWFTLDRALRDRHDALDSVRRISRRNALDAALGIGALAEAQDAAKVAIDGASFAEIVAAEKRLDERVDALKGLVGYHITTRDTVDLADLVACLDLMNAAISRATSAYNLAVDNNNHLAQTRSLSWLAACAGQSRAFAFRPQVAISGQFDDFQLVA